MYFFKSHFSSVLQRINLEANSKLTVLRDPASLLLIRQLIEKLGLLRKKWSFSPGPDLNTKHVLPFYQSWPHFISLQQHSNLSTQQELSGFHSFFFFFFALVKIHFQIYVFFSPSYEVGKNSSSSLSRRRKNLFDVQSFICNSETSLASRVIFNSKRNLLDRVLPAFVCMLGRGRNFFNNDQTQI